MKPRRPLLVAPAGTALVVIVIVALASGQRKQTPFQNAPKIISAWQACSRDQVAAGKRLPPEVSVEGLLQGGHLTSNDLNGFVGMDLTFCTPAADTSRQMILAHARTAEGQYICLLADGSVQQLSQRTYGEQRATLGQPTLPAAGSQPSGSETNRTPEADGSGR